ncbi:serine hydrolase domain-containing protein [Streptomyces sp. NPDC000594]|uniref:serine hydrolase domain-containing protein n=1 Tax=Streptomyces sp. NPDC000594 TaxID=3154261 RepID=UPI00332BE578
MHTPRDETQFGFSPGSGGGSGAGEGVRPSVEGDARLPPVPSLGTPSTHALARTAPERGACAGIRPQDPEVDAREVRDTPPDLDHWQSRLDHLRAAHQVPGASLAILTGGRIHPLVSGVLHRGTATPVTPGSVFQLGSLAKVYTATLIMRLVDSGELALGTRVVDVLPEFATADSDITGLVTIRQLLSHTSGLACGLLHDSGRGDDCLARSVEACRSLAPDRRPGTAVSYSDTGYVLLGRIAEVITGTTWDRALRERLLSPLGLDHTMTLPEEALRFPVAMGHADGGPGKGPVPVPHWDPAPRSLGPAARVIATAADLAGLARMHLDGGTAPGGARVMSVDAVAAMQHRETGVPDQWTVGADGWGLGWTLYDWDGIPGYGHDGSAAGQWAFLRVVPETGVAVVLLTNGGRARRLADALLGEILEELCGVLLPEPFAPPADPPAVDLAPLVGTYRRAGAVITVTAEGGRGRLVHDPADPTPDCRVPRELELIPVSGTVFAGSGGADEDEWLPVVFTRLPDGSRCLYIGMRAANRSP